MLALKNFPRKVTIVTKKEQKIFKIVQSEMVLYHVSNVKEIICCLKEKIIIVKHLWKFSNKIRKLSKCQKDAMTLWFQKTLPLLHVKCAKRLILQMEMEAVFLMVLILQI